MKPITHFHVVQMFRMRTAMTPLIHVYLFCVFLIHKQRCQMVDNNELLRMSKEVIMV
jgi:hypothetical protein